MMVDRLQRRSMERINTVGPPGAERKWLESMDDLLAYSSLPVRNYMTHAQERGQSLAENFAERTDDVAEILEERSPEDYSKRRGVLWVF